MNRLEVGDRVFYVTYPEVDYTSPWYKETDKLFIRKGVVRGVYFLQVEDVKRVKAQYVSYFIEPLAAGHSWIFVPRVLVSRDKRELADRLFKMLIGE